MMIELGRETYGFRMPSGDMVEVGDRMFPIFKPHLKINRWDGECFLCPSIEQTGHTKLKVSESLVESESNLSIIRMYPIAPSEQWELGSFRMEITHKKKPPTNKILSSILSHNVKAFYQPPLTQEEIEQGCIRPDNIVGSYAFYHATKGGMNDSKGKDYKCGIVGHKPRPRIIDDNGDWVWAELSIDLKTGLQVITIPLEFYNSAKYPIRHDAGADTFGYTSVGGTAGFQAANFCYTFGNSTYSPASDGTGVSMSIYGKDSGDNVKMALYDSSDESLDAETDAVALDAAAAWKTANFSGSPSVASAIAYRLARNSDGNSYTYYNSGGASLPQWKTDANTYEDPWPNPAVWGDAASGNERLFSIYCTYTPSGAGWSNIAKFVGVGEADILKIAGVAKADIAKIKGVAV